jgi:hypothetical protein
MAKARIARLSFKSMGIWPEPFANRKGRALSSMRMPDLLYTPMNCDSLEYSSPIFNINPGSKFKETPFSSKSA